MGPSAECSVSLLLQENPKPDPGRRVTRRRPASKSASAPYHLHDYTRAGDAPPQEHGKASVGDRGLDSGTAISRLSQNNTEVQALIEGPTPENLRILC